MSGVCTQIPMTGSATPCNGGCAVVSTMDELENNPNCFALRIRISVDDCPNYPQTFHWTPGAGCMMDIPVPVGGPFKVTYVYYEACGQCSSNVDTREVFRDTRTYEIKPNTVGAAENNLIFKYLVSSSSCN